MSKLLIHIFLFLLVLLSLLRCYEPQDGCLNIDAVNYEVSADDACSDCCIFPSLSLSMQYLVEWPEDTVLMRYGVYYPATNAVSGDSFLIERSRFFISNVKLVNEDGTEVSVLDTLRLTFASEEVKTFTDNFAKMDRDEFQARELGTMKTEGVFNEVCFTLGLEEFLQQNEITSGLPTGHPLDNSTDTIIYEESTGFIPNLLILRHDTVNINDSLEFRFFNPVSISLPLAHPFVIERGFNIKLTLKTDYSDWFAGVDFRNDSYLTIEQKIRDNLTNVFSVTEIKLE